MHKHTHRDTQIHTNTDTLTFRHTDAQTLRHTGTHTHRHIHAHTRIPTHSRRKAKAKAEAEAKKGDSEAIVDEVVEVKEVTRYRAEPLKQAIRALDVKWRAFYKGEGVFCEELDTLPVTHTPRERCDK